MSCSSRTALILFALFSLLLTACSPTSSPFPIVAPTVISTLPTVTPAPTRTPLPPTTTPWPTISPADLQNLEWAGRQEADVQAISRPSGDYIGIGPVLRKRGAAAGQAPLTMPGKILDIWEGYGCGGDNECLYLLLEGIGLSVVEVQEQKLIEVGQFGPMLHPRGIVVDGYCAYRRGKIGRPCVASTLPITRVSARPRAAFCSPTQMAMGPSLF